MAEIKIDKGVPIPETRGRPIGGIYPWDEMDVGDSFICRSGRVNTAFRICHVANKRLAPKKFLARKTSEGHRIWRVK